MKNYKYWGASTFWDPGNSLSLSLSNVIWALEQITVPLRGSAEILLYAGTPSSGEFEKTVYVGLKSSALVRPLFLRDKDD